MDGQVFKGQHAEYIVDALLPLGYGRASIILKAASENGEELIVKLFRGTPETVGRRDALAGFQRETRLHSTLSHDNILPILDWGVGTLGIATAPFIILPFCPYGDLRSAIQAQSFIPFGRAMRLLGQIAAAVDYAHSQGILHGDIKPENVLFWRSAEHACLADFGAARYYPQSVAISGAEPGFGTPDYLSPEELRGRRASPASDLYSFALVAYEILTGTLPFDHSVAYESMDARLNERLDDPLTKNPLLPPRVVEVFRHAFSVDPSRRPRSAVALVTALAEDTSTNLLIKSAASSDDRQTQIAVTDRESELASTTPNSLTPKDATLAARGSGAPTLFLTGTPLESGLPEVIQWMARGIGAAAAKEGIRLIVEGGHGCGYLAAEAFIHTALRRGLPVRGSLTQVVEPGREPVLKDSGANVIELDPNIAKWPDGVPQAEAVVVLGELGAFGPLVWLARKDGAVVLPVRGTRGTAEELYFEGGAPESRSGQWTPQLKEALGKRIPTKQSAVRVATGLVQLISAGNPPIKESQGSEDDLLRKGTTKGTASGIQRSGGEAKGREYDVFLSYNRKDLQAVRRIARSLVKAGVLPWLDIWDLKPGDSWIRLLDDLIGRVRTAAVFVGPSGLGPWQTEEVMSFLQAIVQRGGRLIPVILPGVADPANLPLFLGSRGAVDFRKDNAAIHTLIRGISSEPRLRER